MSNYNVVETRVFVTQREANAFAEDYLRKWPPQGYGTSVDVYKVLNARCRPGQPFVDWGVNTSRMASCD